VSLAVHEAVSKSTELDLMSWVMRRVPLHRQTCRHAAEKVSEVPTIAQTKDGRWFVTMPLEGRDEAKIIDFLDGYGMAADLAGTTTTDGAGRSIPGSSGQSERSAHLAELLQRFTRKPWERCARYASRTRTSLIRTGRRGARLPRSSTPSWAGP
jgi:hypothetical protein